MALQHAYDVASSAGTCRLDCGCEVQGVRCQICEAASGGVVPCAMRARRWYREESSQIDLPHFHHTPRPSADFASLIRSTGCAGSSRSRLRPDLRAQLVDGDQAPRRLQMPEGPAIAGVEPLRERADALNGAAPLAECKAAVGAHQRPDLALGIAKERARQNHSALEQRR